MKPHILQNIKFCFILFLISIFFFQTCENRKFNNDSVENSPRSNLSVNERKSIESNFKNISIKKDEFTKFTWYQDKSSPKYVNQNGFYLSFGIRDDGFVSPLHLQIQYYSVDWLFIQSYDFNIDGNTFSLYTYGSVKRDNGDGYIWEWYDSILGDETLLILKAISTAKIVKIRFNGSKYYDTKTLTRNQIKAVKNILSTYENIQNILAKPSNYTDTLKFPAK